MGFGKSGTGAILRSKEEQALGALGNEAAIGISGDLVLKEDFRVLKQEIGAVITGLTAGEGFALYFGIANGELSDTEISECILADGPSDRNDRVKQERAERQVKILGKFEPMEPLSGSTEMVLKGEGNSPIVISKFRWTYSDPEGWQHFIFNMDGTGLTTGATVRSVYTTYGVWVT